MTCFGHTYNWTLRSHTESLVLFRVRHYAEDVIKGVSLPRVLSAKPGRRRQFVVPRYVRIKLVIGLAATTAAPNKERSPCRAMAIPS